MWHNVKFRSIMAGTNGFLARAECETCEWHGPWRNSLWNMKKQTRDANRHDKKLSKLARGK